MWKNVQNTNFVHRFLHGKFSYGSRYSYDESMYKRLGWVFQIFYHISEIRGRDKIHILSQQAVTTRAHTTRFKYQQQSLDVFIKELKFV